MPARRYVLKKATTKAVKAAAAKAVKAAAAVEKAAAEAAEKASKQRRKRVTATTGRDTSSSSSNACRRDVRRLPFCLPSSRISSRADLPYSELVNWTKKHVKAFICFYFEYDNGDFSRLATQFPVQILSRTLFS